jgi:hypothetical protein
MHVEEAASVITTATKVGASDSSNAVSGRSVFGRADTAATVNNANRQTSRSRSNIIKSANPKCNRMLCPIDCQPETQEAEGWGEETWPSEFLGCFVMLASRSRCRNRHDRPQVVFSSYRLGLCLAPVRCLRPATQGTVCIQPTEQWGRRKGQEYPSPGSRQSRPGRLRP